MEIQRVETILGRKQYESLINTTSDKVILITGGAGSIGKRLAERCPNAIVTDVDDLDITNDADVSVFRRKHRTIDAIINLAGEKHAPQGEDNCFEALSVNTMGVANLLGWFPDAKFIQASTCKACNPETVYGATKLIAERMALNEGGVVARFFNVVETSGNVFEIWENVPTELQTVHVKFEGGHSESFVTARQGQYREVYDCNRYFISLDEVVGLLIACIELPTGRYSVFPGLHRNMVDIYHALYQEPPFLKDRRRGDRKNELLCSTSEHIIHDGVNPIIQIVSHHDANH